MSGNGQSDALRSGQVSCTLGTSAAGCMLRPHAARYCQYRPVTQALPAACSRTQRHPATSTTTQHPAAVLLLQPLSRVRVRSPPRTGTLDQPNNSKFRTNDRSTIRPAMTIFRPQISCTISRTFVHLRRESYDTQIRFARPFRRRASPCSPSGPASHRLGAPERPRAGHRAGPSSEPNESRCAHSQRAAASESQGAVGNGARAADRIGRVGQDQ